MVAFGAGVSVVESKVDIIKAFRDASNILHNYAQHTRSRVVHQTHTCPEGQRQRMCVRARVCGTHTHTHNNNKGQTCTEACISLLCVQVWGRLWKKLFGKSPVASTAMEVMVFSRVVLFSTRHDSIRYFKKRRKLPAAHDVKVVSCLSIQISLVRSGQRCTPTDLSHTMDCATMYNTHSRACVRMLVYRSSYDTATQFKDAALPVVGSQAAPPGAAPAMRLCDPFVLLPCPVSCLI